MLVASIGGLANVAVLSGALGDPRRSPARVVGLLVAVPTLVCLLLAGVLLLRSS